MVVLPPVVNAHSAAVDNAHFTTGGTLPTAPQTPPEHPKRPPPCKPQPAPVPTLYALHAPCCRFTTGGTRANSKPLWDAITIVLHLAP